MKKSIILVLSFFFLCSKGIDNNVFEILLTPANVDKFDISLSGAVIGPRGKQRPFDEQIKKYPDGYIVKNSYNICLQNNDAK
ncbi:MAG: hypothetical protein M1426_00325 [Patescibacteria group bacterium]|nr:hypothetical protein [Patescibacteria group bacterium]